MAHIEKVFIEIPKGSSIKYEIDKTTGQLAIDRFLYGANVYPWSYGFIDKTLEMDADPIDVAVCVSKEHAPGVLMDVKILGAIDLIDNGEQDTKLLGVFVGDPVYKNVENYDELPKIEIDKLIDFFKNYKNLENKKCEIKGFFNKEESIKIIKNARIKYTEYQKVASQMTEAEFLKTKLVK